MAKCDCYHQHGMRFLCYGTKNMEECSCGGDTSKCNFYPEKRKQKTQPMRRGGTTMDIFTIQEEAYKRGYEAGKRDAAKWIPVTERLPKEEDYYLCNVASFAFPGTFFVTLLKYYVDGGFIDEVTHWMPLPSTEGLE